MFIKESFFNNRSKKFFSTLKSTERTFYLNLDNIAKTVRR